MLHLLVVLTTANRGNVTAGGMGEEGGWGEGEREGGCGTRVGGGAAPSGSPDDSQQGKRDSRGDGGGGGMGRGGGGGGGEREGGCGTRVGRDAAPSGSPDDSHLGKRDRWGGGGGGGGGGRREEGGGILWNTIPHHPES